MDSRDFRSIFRQMFGFQNPGGHHHHNREDFYQEDREDVDQRRGPVFHHDSEHPRDDDSFNFSSRGFNVYTDPFEMNRFFDQQLDEMLKMFGQSFGFRPDPGVWYGVLGDNKMIPLVEPEDDVGPSHGRDFMLKDDGQQPRVDTEVDSGNVDMRELDRLMKYRDNPGLPAHQEQKPTNLLDLFSPPSFDRRESPSGGRRNFYSFGSSLSQRSVSGPDGRLETTRTVRNSDGSEVVTVTKQLGDKSYEIVTNRSKDGSVSTEEKLVNIAENELDKFKEDLKENKQQLRPQPRDDMIRRPPAHDELLPSLWRKFFDD